LTSPPFSISVERRFLSDFLSLPTDAQTKVTRAVEHMRDDPDHDSKPLVKYDGVFRRKIGRDHRMLFTKGTRWVHIYSVEHRQGVYRGNITMPKRSPTAQSEYFENIQLDETENSAASLLPDYLNRETLTGYGVSDSLQIDAVIDWDGSYRGLTDLEELAVPSNLIEILLDQVAETTNQIVEPDDLGFIQRTDGGTRLSSERDPKDIQLIKTDVLDAFWGPLLGGLRKNHRIEELIIVSPWITAWDSPKSSLNAVLKFVKNRKIPTRIITRPPDKVNHRKAVDAFAQLPTVEITELPQLHAKFYVCDMAPFPVGLIGSANSTKESFGYSEVGVLVHGRNKLEGFVRELMSLTDELRSYSQ